MFAKYELFSACLNVITKEGFVKLGHVMDMDAYVVSMISFALIITKCVFFLLTLCMLNFSEGT